ncbi:MAG: 50S ribosomal protein L10 [Gammaproteobacteria bacterium]|nr:50S ribosomal protein L10 [Gammaproteobacteria bacterium]
MLELAQKQAIVAEVNAVAATAVSAIASENRGLTAVQMNDLRNKARKEGVYMRVVKNTLARRAVDGTSFACMREQLVGPLVLAFSKEDPGAAARVISEFVKGNNKLVVKVISLSGKVLAASDLERLAKMPTKDQAISMMMSVMLAPITMLVRTINEPTSKLVRTVAAVGVQKQAAGS